MGDRKVLNNYVPWNFDPKKIRRGKKKTSMVNVRSMLPCSVRCSSCGNFMAQATKFNSRKEIVKGETYHGIKLFRLYMKCTHCPAVFTVRTDPEHDDYIIESGATRNFQLWRAEGEADEEDRAQKQEEEKYDAMRALENRTSDSKRHSDILDGLEEIKAINKRNAAFDANVVLDGMHKKRKAEQELAASLDERDEQELKQALKRLRAGSARNVSASKVGVAAHLPASIKAAAPATTKPRPKFRMHKRRQAAPVGAARDEPAASAIVQQATPAPASGGLGGLGEYDSSDSDSSPD